MGKVSGLIGAAGLALILSLGTALSAMAHDENVSAEAKDQKVGSGETGEGHGFGPMGRLMEKLGLSEVQASKLKELFKKQAEETKPLREQTRIDMDTLKLKVDSKAPDAEIKQVLDSLSSDRKKMEAGRQKMADQLSMILTSTQRAKMLLGMSGHGGEMMKGMMKHRMEGGRQKGEALPAGEPM